MMDDDKRSLGRQKTKMMRELLRLSKDLKYVIIGSAGTEFLNNDTRQALQRTLKLVDSDLDTLFTRIDRAKV